MLYDNYSYYRFYFSIIFGILGLVIIVTVAVFLIIRWNRNKKIKYFTDQLHQIYCNDALEKALNGYSDKPKENYWLIKIDEVNSFTNKEHFFKMTDSISIGRDFNQNDIHVFDEKADDVQCLIQPGADGPTLEAKSLSVPIVYSCIKKKKRPVSKKHQMTEKEKIRIITGDEVCFGDTKLIFAVFNDKLGLV